MNKTKQLYLDTPIWNIEQPKRYALAFVHILESPVGDRPSGSEGAGEMGAVDWLDYIRFNKN